MMSKADRWRLTPQELEDRRAARLARLKRQRPYRAKPDLPGMTKRVRARPEYLWRKAVAYRFGRSGLVRYGALIRYRKKKRKPPKQPRELVARPKPARSNKRLYRREEEHGRETFGRAGIGLLWQLRCFWA
jgi:hypothetical protein